MDAGAGIGDAHPRAQGRTGVQDINTEKSNADSRIRAELVSASVFVVLSIILLLTIPFQIAELTSSVHLSSRYRTLTASDFPFAIGVALLLLSSGYFIQMLRGGVGTARKFNITAEALRKIIVVYVMLSIYVVLFRLIGYLIPTAIFLMATTLYLGNRNWISIIGLAIVTPLVIYTVLNKILFVSIP